MNKSQGFTLIEVLIVVMVMTITLPIVFKSFIHVGQVQQLRLFITEIEETLYDAQMTALSSGTYITVEFNKNHHQVQTSKGYSQVIQHFSYPKVLDVEAGQGQYTIVFTPKGVIQNPCTFYFSIGNEKYALVQLIGQGRFYVKKI